MFFMNGQTRTVSGTYKIVRLTLAADITYPVLFKLCTEQEELYE